MTTTDNETGLEPCPLPEPLRTLAREMCFECRTGTVINGRGTERVHAPHRSHEPRDGHANWFHKVDGGNGFGYGCDASALYELNSRVSSTAPAGDDDYALVAHAVNVAREVQEFIWADCYPTLRPYDAEGWRKLFQKRVDCIAEVDLTRHGGLAALRKRLLQQAALSIKALALVNRWAKHERISPGAAASPAAPTIAELLKEIEPGNANYDAVDLAERVRRVCNRVRKAERSTVTPASEHRWRCACGWVGTPSQMTVGNDLRMCPKCGGSGGLILDAAPTPPKTCEHGVPWSMECLSCGHSDYIAVAAPAAPQEDAQQMTFRNTKEAMEYAQRHAIPAAVPVSTPSPADAARNAAEEIIAYCIGPSAVGRTRQRYTDQVLAIISKYLPAESVGEQEKSNERE